MNDEWGPEDGHRFLELLNPALTLRVIQLANDRSDEFDAPWDNVRQALCDVIGAGLEEYGYEDPHESDPEAEREFYAILKADYEAYQDGTFLDQFETDRKKERYEDFVPPDPDDFNWSWEQNEVTDRLDDE